MTLISDGAWVPLGEGFFAPIGSVSNATLAGRLQAYKRDVAGNYRSLTPDQMQSHLTEDRYWVSEKIDGEQWFLYKQGEVVLLLAPNGRAIRDFPVTAEASRLLPEWSGILAGELNTEVEGRPCRVFDLHAALGGGANANTNTLRFRAFDLLLDGEEGSQREPFGKSVDRMRALLSEGHLIRPVDYHQLEEPAQIHGFFQEVTAKNGEGIVIRSNTGPTFKVKPRISLDVAVIGYSETETGIQELLVGLIPESPTESGMPIQLLGAIRTGFSREQRTQLAKLLRPLHVDNPLALTSHTGAPIQWVRPEVVIEVHCFGLITHRASGEPVRKWRLQYQTESGWQPIGRKPAVTLCHAAFDRIREDKRVDTHDVRWSQVTDLAPVGVEAEDLETLPTSEIIRREVYTKTGRKGDTAVRKVVAWVTHKENIDPRYPAFAALFTDFSAARTEPLSTQLQTAGSRKAIMARVDQWLASEIRRGWDCLHRVGAPEPSPETKGASVDAPPDPHTLTIAFGRSSSPTFPIVRRRLTALSALGALTITPDEKGREAWFELRIQKSMVASYRRIHNLLKLVQRWKSTEISLDNEPLGKHETQDAINRLEEIHACWRRRKSKGPAGCLAECRLGCDRLRIVASHRYLDAAPTSEPDWYAVGAFDGKGVVVDKKRLRSQVGWRRNRLVSCCPNFDRTRIEQAIERLPDRIEAKEPDWRLPVFAKDGNPAWVWPAHAPLPPRLESASRHHAKTELGTGLAIQSAAQSNPLPRLERRASLPPTTYADVHGQDEAITAVRDLIELPLRHGHLFTALGAEPKPSGIILAGPPGTGKTMLARAVAHECEAHLETISGPEVLSKWAGESERALRDVFERAGQHAPSVILFDELDSIAGNRDSADSQYQQTLVAQLLTLLDGLEARKRIYVLATTNRADAIDPALQRPGRFDRVVRMGLPNREGRLAILRHHMQRYRLESGLNLEKLLPTLLAETKGASGADLAYLCEAAARACVKAGVAKSLPAEGLRLSESDIRGAVRGFRNLST